MTAPGARVTRSTNQAVPSWALTAVSFTSAEWDTDAIFNIATPTRLTCKTSGVYLIQGSVQFAANATGPRDLGIRLNGTTFIVSQRNATVGATATADMNVTATYRLNVNDYVELLLQHYVNPIGTNLNIVAAAEFSPRFAMVRLGAF